jgi:hypothetical protein
MNPITIVTGCPLFQGGRAGLRWLRSELQLDLRTTAAPASSVWMQYALQRRHDEGWLKASPARVRRVVGFTNSGAAACRVARGPATPAYWMFITPVTYAGFEGQSRDREQAPSDGEQLTSPTHRRSCPPRGLVQSKLCQRVEITGTR